MLKCAPTLLVTAETLRFHPKGSVGWGWTFQRSTETLWSLCVGGGLAGWTLNEVFSKVGHESRFFSSNWDDRRWLWRCWPEADWLLHGMTKQPATLYMSSQESLLGAEWIVGTWEFSWLSGLLNAEGRRTDALMSQGWTGGLAKHFFIISIIKFPR